MDDIDKLNLLMLLEQKSSNDPLQKQKFQSYSTKLLDKVVSNINITSNNTQLFGNTVFSGQIYKSNDNILSRDIALQNNLPIYNMTGCEAQLKKFYNLSENSEILYIASKTDGLMNNHSTTSYNILAYDNQSKHKLDLTLCNKTSTVEMPLTESSAVNLTLYRDMKEQGVDLLNPNDPIFNDICISYNDNISGTTLNWRRQNLYPQKIPMCVGFNCTYQGINEFNYVNCECSGLGSTSDILNMFSSNIMESLSEINIGIVSCYKQIPSVRYFII
jgi:hypothetical protein